MTTNKTQELLDKVHAGTHRIQNSSVYRFVPSRNEWVWETLYRKDVIFRVEMALFRSHNAA